MGVYIKGMDMPKRGCDHCFLRAGNYCSRLAENESVIEYAVKEERHPDCPLTEAPKHGTWSVYAIDTFKLTRGITAYGPVYECSECGGFTDSYLRFDEPKMPEDADFPRFCPNCGARMDDMEG